MVRPDHCDAGEHCILPKHAMCLGKSKNFIMPLYVPLSSIVADRFCSNERWSVRPPTSCCHLSPRSLPLTLLVRSAVECSRHGARRVLFPPAPVRLSSNRFVERHELEVPAHAKFHHDATPRLNGRQEGQVPKFCLREDLSVLDPDHHASRFVLQAVQRTCEDAFFVVPSDLLLSQVRHAHAVDLGQVRFHVSQSTCVDVDQSEVSTTDPVRVASFQAAFGWNAHAKCAAFVQKLHETLAVGTDEVGAHELQPRRRGSRTHVTKATASHVHLRGSSLRT